MEPTPALDGLVGVYHADGGPLGEAKYIVGKLLGTAHCALCDITHSPVRRKPDWDRMVAGLGVPFQLLHLNEMAPDVAAATARVGSPVVLARLSDGTIEPVLRADELEELGGSVEAFADALHAALAARATPHGA
ncbi:MAG: hypothetical protein MUF09_02025 [Candidatus Nanopelagicales bacterium]|jgi:hypothetical protein|nr:hypothetical protein [Candidatus Nanopelagicales bacterium]